MNPLLALPISVDELLHSHVVEWLAWSSSRLRSSRDQAGTK
jgi:hypothetical protein